jgi:hypothetical protein
MNYTKTQSQKILAGFLAFVVFLSINPVLSIRSAAALYRTAD